MKTSWEKYSAIYLKMYFGEVKPSTERFTLVLPCDASKWIIDPDNTPTWWDSSLNW